MKRFMFEREAVLETTTRVMQCCFQEAETEEEARSLIDDMFDWETIYENETDCYVLENSEPVLRDVVDLK